MMEMAPVPVHRIYSATRNTLESEYMPLRTWYAQAERGYVSHDYKM
jgi:hypothetical protein